MEEQAEEGMRVKGDIAPFNVAGTITKDEDGIFLKVVGGTEYVLVKFDKKIKGGYLHWRIKKNLLKMRGRGRPHKTKVDKN